MTLTGQGGTFVEALVARDFERLEAAMAPAVRFRGLITKGPFEEHVFGDVNGDGVASLDLLCSGFRREPSGAS